MTGHTRWEMLLPLLLLAASAVAVHQHLGPDSEAPCLPDAPDTSQKVGVLDVEELIAEYTVAVNTARAALEEGRWVDAAALTPPGAFAWGRFPQAWMATYVARAIGAAQLGHTARARQDLAQVRWLHATLVANGVCDGAAEVALRHQVATAWVVYGERQYEDAVQRMGAAVALEEASPQEPMLMPPLALAAEALGAMLLERGAPGAAMQAYAAPLRRYPRRLPALYGAALAAELDGDLTNAQAFYARLAEAAAPAGDGLKLAQAEAFLANGHREP